jgi:nitroreductase
MPDILDIIRNRRSLRVAFDPARPVSREDLGRILEAARWTPSAHNMQNWEIVVVDDPGVLDALARAERPISETFIRENYEQLSFSKEELLKRKTGLLASMFPAAWQTPDFKAAAPEAAAPEAAAAGAAAAEVAAPAPAAPGADALQRGGISSRQRFLLPSPVMLVVVYDPSRRAPASEGDFLGIISLGCLMENMWLEAEALGLGMQIVSALADAATLEEILAVPEDRRVAFSCRVGYPVQEPADQLRVRRDVDNFTHFNRYGG